MSDSDSTDSSCPLKATINEEELRRSLSQITCNAPVNKTDARFSKLINTFKGKGGLKADKAALLELLSNADDDRNSDNDCIAVDGP